MKAKTKMSYIRYPYIFPGNIMEQIHKGGMSRYKKVASNSQYGSNRDKLYLTGVVVTCTGMMCSMDKVGEAVDVSYFVLAWSLTVSPVWANLGWHCLNGCTTTWLKKAHGYPIRLEG